MKTTPATMPSTTPLATSSEGLPAMSPSHRSALPLLVTTGEPAGIGMDIVLMLLVTGELTKFSPLWILADMTAMTHRAEALLCRGAIASLPQWRKLPKLQKWQTMPESHNTQYQSTEPHNTEPSYADLDVSTASVLEGQSAPFSHLSEHGAECYQLVADEGYSHGIYLYHVPCREPVLAGTLNAANAAMVEAQLALAHQWAISGRVAGIVTAPLQKSILIEADIRLADGSLFSGHTEYFMHLSGCDEVVMMLANAKMKVALVTTHLPLRAVATAVTQDKLRKVLAVLLQALQQKFGIASPKVLVCGLNPHAGEGGHLGTEEIEVINPVLREFQAMGRRVSDAMPADTLFTERHLADCDAVLAMYHDQGLPVLKSHGFGDTVNITLGLPYVRTSVDHGTALDLAGTGTASASSLLQALKLARQMCQA